MNAQYLVSADSIANDYADGTCIGFRFSSKNPGYRGVFLSLVNTWYVELDGKVIPPENLTFEINGKAPRTLKEIYHACMEHWDVDEALVIHVSMPGGISQGRHTLKTQPSIIDQYGYAWHDEEWVRNPPKAGEAICKIVDVGAVEPYSTVEFTI